MVENGSNTGQSSSDRSISEYHENISTNRRSILVAGATGISTAGCMVLTSRDDEDVNGDDNDVNGSGGKDELATDSDRSPANVILIIPDGMSTSHLTAARHLAAIQDDEDAYPNNLAKGDTGQLAVDEASAVGQMSTHPKDPNLSITDSAAAGTAMATGEKTANGVLGGVIQNGRYNSRKTILEAAAEVGMTTGLVTTTRITHATPAAFAAHVPDRGQEENIAAQYVDHSLVDVLLGGGRMMFDSDQRSDGRDLLADARTAGYTTISSEEELDDGEGRILGLFGSTAGRSSHMSYYLDRRYEPGNNEPGLVDMAKAAINRLTSLEEGKENGFLLVIEAGRVDHAGHQNDPAIVAEQLEADRTFGYCMEFVDSSDVDTTVVLAPDHETGGMALGSNGYNLDFASIAGLEASVERVQSEASSASEVEELTSLEFNVSARDRLDQNPGSVAEILSTKVNLGWASETHTGEDVPVFAAGDSADRFCGWFDNTDLARRVSDVLSLELQ